jgi:Tol biopolymer transport system component
VGKGFGFGFGFAAAVVAISLSAASAQATFPGRNGILAVQGVSGIGIEYVQPTGAVVRVLCSQTLLCGNAQEARWSPDGRNLVFVDAATARIEVVSSNDTCMWCLLGRPLTTLRGSRPAFAPDGQSVSFAGSSPASPPGLWQTGLSSTSNRSVIQGPLSDAVWSSTGELAIVRRGAVWVRTSGRRAALRRMVSGTSPSWSPGGSKLALSRGGWITVIDLKRAHLRRVAPGAAPAWSPDGTQIAYIGSDQILRIVPAGGGRPRSLGAQARSVDWQPLPRRSTRGCPLPAGSKVLVARAEGVISSRMVTSQGYQAEAWFGCLRGIGKDRQLLLSTIGGGYWSSVDGALTAGRFALLSTQSGDKYGACSLSLTLVDLATGASTPLFTSYCGYESAPLLGSPALDSPALDSSGFAAWREAHQTPLYQSFNGVSCPSISFCVAADGNGTVATSSDPTGGRPAWSLADVYGSRTLSSVSCPTTDLCAATTSYGGDVLTSTNPSGGASQWTSSHVDDKELGIFNDNFVSCPSASLCVMADNSGNIVSSTDPTGGSSAWTSVHVDSGTPAAFSAISCPSASLCVALDATGNVATSSNPTGGASAWSLAQIGTARAAPPLAGVACPSVSLCVVADGGGNIATSTNPTGGSSAWSLTRLSSGHPGAISCPSASLCVAVDGAGNVITSTNPTGGASAWQVANVDGTNRMTSISCPSVSRCLATDDQGNVVSSDDPTGGTSAWTASAVDVPDCAAMKTQCIAETLYARDDGGTRVIDSAPPGNGKSLSNVNLGANSTILYWTHDGQQRQATLR